MATQLDAFGSNVASSSWWDTVRKGYCTTSSNCVGDGPAGTKVAVTSAPATSYTDSAIGGPSTLQQYIQGLITGGQITQPDAQTVLVFFFPATTTVSLDGAASCQVFGGYHNYMTVGGVQFPYAVVAECAPPTQGPKITLLQQTTYAASHEVIEAATDPIQTPTAIGFYLPLPPEYNDQSIFPWNNLGGGEAADMCVDFLGLGQDEATEGSFTVERIWSNAAAAAGGDPCVPAASAAYFNVAPETWLLSMPVGSTQSFRADGFSTAAMSDWTVLGGDFNATSTDPSPYLTITIDGAQSATINNGGYVTVSVTLKQDPANLANVGSVLGATGLLLSADNLQNPTKAHVWPFLVVAPSDAVAADAGVFVVDASAQMDLRRPGLQAAPAPIRISDQALAGRVRQVFEQARAAAQATRD
jgi:hypothetical protein